MSKTICKIPSSDGNIPFPMYIKDKILKFLGGSDQAKLILNKAIEKKLDIENLSDWKPILEGIPVFRESKNEFLEEISVCIRFQQWIKNPNIFNSGCTLVFAISFDPSMGYEKAQASFRMSNFEKVCCGMVVGTNCESDYSSTLHNLNICISAVDKTSFTRFFPLRWIYMYGQRSLRNLYFDIRNMPYPYWKQNLIPGLIRIFEWLVDNVTISDHNKGEKIMTEDWLMVIPVFDQDITLYNTLDAKLVKHENTIETKKLCGRQGLEVCPDKLAFIRMTLAQFPDIDISYLPRLWIVTPKKVCYIVQGDFMNIENTEEYIELELSLTYNMENRNVIEIRSIKEKDAYRVIMEIFIHTVNEEIGPALVQIENLLLGNKWAGTLVCMNIKTVGHFTQFFILRTVGYFFHKDKIYNGFSSLLSVRYQLQINLIECIELYELDAIQLEGLEYLTYTFSENHHNFLSSTNHMNL